MSVIWTKHGLCEEAPYAREDDLEQAILQVQRELFGQSRIYLPVKKKIGAKGGVRNIPDGYLIDLTGARPRLFVVEVELAAHDPLRHIAVQILQFSLSFEAEGRGVRKILFDAIQQHPDIRAQCDQYVAAREFRNLDHLLDHLVFEAPFSALVIIDDLHDNLENVLSSKFQFGVEVLQLARYKHANDGFLYAFEPFLADVEVDVPPVDSGDVDTVVVPARADGLDTFLGEDRWYAVRIHGSMKPQIKYIGLYQVAPKSAITHMAPVKSIEPWQESGKYVLNFAAPAQSIGPIPLVKGGRVKQLQNLRYTTKSRLQAAKTLDDIW